MMLPELSSLGDEHKHKLNSKSSNKKLAGEQAFQLPSLESLYPSSPQPNYELPIDNDDGQSAELTGELAEEYKRIKESYNGLINMFQSSIDKEIKNASEHKSEIKLSDYNFKTLADFERAIDDGSFNLNDYGIVEIDNLIRELSNLENRIAERDLKDYNFKSIDDFNRAVDRGELRLSRYGVGEISKLIDELEDETPLKLSDYDIATFGDVDIEEVVARLDQEAEFRKRLNPEYSTKVINEKINAYRSKVHNSLPALSSLSEDNILPTLDFNDEDSQVKIDSKLLEVGFSEDPEEESYDDYLDEYVEEEMFVEDVGFITRLFNNILDKIFNR